MRWKGGEIRLRTVNGIRGRDTNPIKDTYPVPEVQALIGQAHIATDRKAEIAMTLEEELIQTNGERKLYKKRNSMLTSTPYEYDPDNPLPVLEERHMMDILMYLYTHGRSKKTDVYKGISLNSRMPEKLTRLHHAGLIVVHNYEGNSNARGDVELTDYGALVTQVVLNLSRILKNRPRDEVDLVRMGIYPDGKVSGTFQPVPMDDL